MYKKLQTVNELILQEVRVKNRGTEVEGSASSEDFLSQKQQREVYKSEMYGIASVYAAFRASDSARFPLEGENWNSRKKRCIKRSEKSKKTELRR